MHEQGKFLFCYVVDLVFVFVYHVNTHKKITQEGFFACSFSYSAEIFLYKPWRLKGFFQFEIIINVLNSFSRSIWIPMSWIYGH